MDYKCFFMDALRQLLSVHYGLKPLTIKRIAGYANANYKVEMADGSVCVLKELSLEPGQEPLLLAEAEVLKALNAAFKGRFQLPIFSLQGDYLVQDVAFPNRVFRLLSWLEGAFLHEVAHSPGLLRSLGDFLARMDSKLMDYYFPAIAARRIDWDLSRLPELRERLEDITDASLRSKVDYYLLQYRELVVPVLGKLRHSLIHNDGNDWNVLVENQAVTGIIDFGDIVHAPLIQELAVCLTYACFDKEDPLQWAVHVLSAYHAVLPLKEEETDLLYYLVAGRLCMSLLNAAHARKGAPDNAYLDVSIPQVTALLDSWLEINPVRARSVFRQACSLPDQVVEEVSVSLEKRRRHIGSVLSVSYRDPIKVNRAAFQYMYDAFGHTFLDAYNNIPHVGHEHPRVVDAGQRQMARLNTNTRYLYDELASYSEQLLQKFPAPLNKVFFVNSGSAASDLAIRLAQTHSGQRNIMVLEHGYHGHTRLGVDISHYKFGSRGGSGQAEYILKVPIPDTYRGAFTCNDGSAGEAYAKKAIEVMDQAKAPVAAFIAEPVVGCAGQVPLAKNYLKHLYPAIRKQGGLCISDEVQTGFGRLGEVFWGFELQGVVPDIVVLGKPIGNGHPMGAVVTTDAIASSFDNGMEFFSSFGGNPVSCAIGSAVLEVIREEELQRKALTTGNYFLERLRTLQAAFPEIGDVRGQGLFLGIEFVKDPETKEHDEWLADLVKNKMRENHILVSTDGPFNNIVKMKPPLCFNARNADHVVIHLEAILSGITK